MKILVISNFYPPFFFGGYELGCRDVVRGLADRGHEMRVLTSTYGIQTNLTEQYVDRKLHVFPTFVPQLTDFKTFVKRQVHNRQILREAIHEFQPDLVYLWNLQFGLMTLAEPAFRLAPVLAAYVSDHWPIDPGGSDTVWRLENPSKSSSVSQRWALLYRIVMRARLHPSPKFPFRFHTAHYCSEYLRSTCRSAIDSQSHEVIHWGVNAEPARSVREFGPVTKFLYSGQLIASKGVHTALQAFLIFRERYPEIQIDLSLVGSAVDADYEKHLRKLVTEHKAENSVHFLGKLSREELPRQYSGHEALLFPSEWNEPFSIALLEAMAHGLAVIGTRTGGTLEILRDGENAICFEAGSVDSCLRAMERLLSDSYLAKRIQANAIQCIKEKFTLSRMIDRIECSLAQTIQRAKRSVEFRLP